MHLSYMKCYWFFVWNCLCLFFRQLLHYSGYSFQSKVLKRWCNSQRCCCVYDYGGCGYIELFFLYRSRKYNDNGPKSNVWDKNPTIPSSALFIAKNVCRKQQKGEGHIISTLYYQKEKYIQKSPSSSITIILFVSWTESTKTANEAATNSITSIREREKILITLLPSPFFLKNNFYYKCTIFLPTSHEKTV